MITKIIDIHCHPSLKPYNNEGYRTDGDIWRGFRADLKSFDEVNPFVRKAIQETERDSQSQLNEFVRGEIKSGFLVLHPPERGWFSRKTEDVPWYMNILLKMLIPDKKMKYLGASMTGIPLKKMEKIIDRVRRKVGIDYFNEETVNEYKYISKNQTVTGPWGFEYRIVNNYDDYKTAASKDKLIPVILTIEGGHALTDVKEFRNFKIPYNDLDTESQDNIKETLKNNIAAIKGKSGRGKFDPAHTPFFVTLCHMYNNFLAGHAKTYGGIVENLLDQRAALNDGISEAGWVAIEELLSRENGQRILIDVKHMSMKARQEYYEFVRNRRAQGDHLPIIASHCAMNGFENNDIHRRDTKKLEKDSFFSRWSINISNEDINEIISSDGLIGLVLHEGRMPGGRVKKEIKKLKRKIRRGRKDRRENLEKLHDLYLKLILSNIFHMVTVVNDKSVWDHICIGSDYDGIMDPFDNYRQSGDFEKLLEEILHYLQTPDFDLIIYKNNRETTLKSNDVRKYLFEYSPEEIVDKIGHKNVETFLSKYFTKKYLKQNS